MRKHFIFLLFLCLLCLSGCQTSNLPPPTDQDTADREFSDSFDAIGYDTESGIWFSDSILSYFDSGGYLYFYDDASRQVIRLCGKTNCSHDSPNCDAYFGDYIHAPTIQSYAGSVYLWRSVNIAGSGVTDELVCADPDGSGHKDLGQLITRDFPSFVSESVIYDGFLYFCCYSPNGDGYFKYRLYRQPLKASQEAELLFATSAETHENHIQNLHLTGRTCWFTDICFSDDSYQTNLWSVNIDTSEKKNILSAVNRNISYAVLGDDVYYTTYNTPYNIEFTPVYKRNVNTGEESLFLSQGGRLTWDGDYFYISTFQDGKAGGDILVVNSDGQILQTIDLSTIRNTIPDPHVMVLAHHIFVESGLSEDGGSDVLKKTWFIAAKDDLLNQNPDAWSVFTREHSRNDYGEVSGTPS